MKNPGVIIAACLLASCSIQPEQTERDELYDFYHQYLTSYSSSAEQQPLLRTYASADTLRRLKEVSSIPEQDIVDSDYFTYTQDYDPAWIPELKIGEPRKLMGGKVIDVWLGIENHQSLHLQAYLRKENGNWKIYRVHDMTDNFEHAIFIHSR